MSGDGAFVSASIHCSVRATRATTPCRIWLGARPSGVVERFFWAKVPLPRSTQSVDKLSPGGIIPHMILTLDAKRRLTLPASLVPAQPGDHFEAEFDAEEDAVVFRRIAKNADWLNVLKACPVKMEDLPPRRREFPKRLKL